MTPRPHRNVHRFAVFTAVCTFLLLVAGALVTSNDAGLSVPDWPLSYGSLTPPMVGGIFYEHGHRMIASFVGLLSIVLAVWLWRVESRRLSAERPPVRRWLRWLGVAALGAVVAQGLLGGLTVLFFLPPWISSAHATLAQLFFATVASIALFTSSWWEREPVLWLRDFRSPSIHTLALATVAAIFLQLILGAAFRHKAFGIIPHLAGAVVVTGLIFWLAGALRRRFSAVPELRFAARGLHILIGLQLLLGAAAWWSRLYAASFPQPIAVMVALTVAHVVTGALVLVSAVLVALVCYRLVRPAGAAFGGESHQQDELSPRNKVGSVTPRPSAAD
jgi:cytochrome c oxidase assembly protein subunit 15